MQQLQSIVYCWYNIYSGKASESQNMNRSGGENFSKKLLIEGWDGVMGGFFGMA